MHNRSIRLISTGGTISCKPTDRGLTPELTARDMLKIINADSENISSTDLFRMDSSNVQPEEWIEIAREIKRTVQNPDIEGIVLTHGTDTMAYTASMLSFMLLDIKIPVVLTGSQLPIVNEDSDGRQNLYDAIEAAGNLSGGVYICFGGSVMLGSRAVKTHTLSRHAFESINYPYIGEVVNGVFRLKSTPPKRKDITSSLEICSDVALIKLIPGTSPKLLDAVQSCGIKGLVVESFGMGGVHSIRRDHNESLVRLMRNGVTVVLTSQCLYEAASLDVYEVSRVLHDAGAISAGDMTTEAAVTKLMWVLGQTNEPTEIKEMFLDNLCGECK